MLTLAQGVVGLGQTIGGALSSAKRPEYELPPALRESLALARINVANPYSAGYGQAKAQSDLTMEPNCCCSTTRQSTRVYSDNCCWSAKGPKGFRDV